MLGARLGVTVGAWHANKSFFVSTVCNMIYQPESRSPVL